MVSPLTLGLYLIIFVMLYSVAYTTSTSPQREDISLYCLSFPGCRTASPIAPYLCFRLLKLSKIGGPTG